ncbi:hypothetical protein Glove_360g38 [Diversispora epigaea]|uniref:Uncharacterized protein n=1 Tax=Diversispora epigaea TaxID=1348612 RepID=A0A397HB27_9GLOM|nr:hypothetical protein Glove_360g38 [Diversispora epigaea]
MLSTVIAYRKACLSQPIETLSTARSLNSISRTITDCNSYKLYHPNLPPRPNVNNIQVTPQKSVLFKKYVNRYWLL